MMPLSVWHEFREGERYGFSAFLPHMSSPVICARVLLSSRVALLGQRWIFCAAVLLRVTPLGKSARKSM